MTNRRILYRLGSSGRDRWMFELSSKLQKYVNHTPYFLGNKFNYPYLKERIEEHNFLLLDEEKQTKVKTSDLQYLKNSEEKFGFNIWDVWEITAQRSKRRRKKPTQKILVGLEYFIKELDFFLDKNEITDFIIYGPSGPGDVILFKMLKQKKINIICLRGVALPRKFGISNNLDNNLWKLKENYLNIKKRDLTKREQEEGLKVLQGYHTNNNKPDCALTFKESKINKLKQFLTKVYKAIKYKQLPSRFRPFFWKPIQSIYDHLGIFGNPVLNEKYILFPLHFQPEASTLIYGKWYNNQLAIIENLVRSIPLGYMLYVKEHSHGYGNRNLSFYKEIKKYACVRLINPHQNNLELIKASSLVVTVTGTSGWEAIMFQKPTIIFGEAFYNIFNCVSKIERITNLPNLIRSLLDKRIELKETLTCITALNKSSYPGLAFLPGDCAGNSSKEENIELLAEGIKDYINKTQNNLDMSNFC